jgi:hypothetical protein
MPFNQTTQSQFGRGLLRHCACNEGIEANKLTSTLCNRLFLLSLCLIISPRLLLFISETTTSTERRTTLTPLESFLALQFGIFLLALSAALVLNVCQLVLNLVPLISIPLRTDSFNSTYRFARTSCRSRSSTASSCRSCLCSDGLHFL